jgi:hypothetical protein
MTQLDIDKLRTIARDLMGKVQDRIDNDHEMTSEGIADLASATSNLAEVLFNLDSTDGGDE